MTNEDRFRFPPEVAQCNRCNRTSNTADDIGTQDRMVQPDGRPCGGTFDPLPPEPLRGALQKVNDARRALAIAEADVVAILNEMQR